MAIAPPSPDFTPADDRRGVRLDGGVRRDPGPGYGADVSRLLRCWLPWLLLAACSRPSDGPVATPSAVVAAVFGEHFFDAQARDAHLEPAAAQALVLPGLVDAQRYKFLQIAELRRIDDSARAGTVAFAVDGWPLAIGVEVRRRDDGWRVAAVDPPEAQRRWLEFLERLPRAPSARPWDGGLAGRDAVGRPTAAVLVAALGDDVAVDGQAAPADELEAAVGEALAVRRRLANDAHATYRPHVALALAADAPAPRQAVLADAARRAGAEAVSLVVRGANGGPALLALARRTEAPGAEARDRVVRLRIVPDGVDLDLDGRTSRVPFAAGHVDAAGIAGALQTLTQGAPPTAGAVVSVDAAARYGEVVALLDACRAAAPQRALLTEAAP
jgi:hypothetical protein